jgi:hypothetical protein
MRLTKLLLLVSPLLTASIFLEHTVRAQGTNNSDGGRGETVPRSSAEKYAAHANHEGVSVGAELLTRKEVAKEFAANVNRCCIVVQVAVYPAKDEPLDVSLGDLMLIVEGSNTSVRPRSATVIAAQLERKNASGGGVTASTGVGVGYESGTYTDPVTGQTLRGHGVYTSTHAGVSATNGVPPPVGDHDREAIERELSSKGLPEAKTTIPVSGYLYFSLPQQKKDTKYRLEYMVKDEKLILRLP